MGGDGQDPAATGGAGGVEPQYVTAKTSVWWDIENCQVPRGCDPHAIAQNISSALVKMNYCGPITISAYGDTTRIPTTVQQALSSTGIALNHVPAGVKDASDKKILVDMLFWAVDNPAPANYLLISGDRDFSNALHQLRMRRYNILLAQPVKASVALVAAVKSVWRWTSLVYGGLPFTNGENTQQEMVPTSVIENIPSNQPASTNAGTVPSVGQKLSTPAGIAAKQFMKAPHEFFGARSTAVASSHECNPQHVQGLICAILAALNTLKVEKIAPTEANIADCIRYGDPKYSNTDVRKALECALDQQMIVKHRLGQMELYVGRIERLWICENPVGGNTEQYPKATWDMIQKFLTSSDGRSALLASECRYEAALILKNSCLKTHPLGEVLRILNMIITMKKWIKIAHLGWKPITITLVDTKSDVDSGS